MGIISAILGLFKNQDTLNSYKEANVDNSYQELPGGNNPLEKIKTKNDDIDPIEILLKKVQGKGHEHFPLLHKEYQTDWLVPCFGLVDFIKERLTKADYNSVVRVLDGISHRNNGAIETIRSKKNIPPDVTPSEYYWTYDVVTRVKKNIYYDYIKFPNVIGMLEMKALWIIVFKSSMYSYYSLLVENIDYLDYMSAALACHKIKIFNKINTLNKKANIQLKEYIEINPDLKGEISFYNNICEINEDYPSDTFIEKYNKLSIGARIHIYLLQISEKNDISSCWRYKTLRMGVLPENVTKEILDSGLYDYEITNKDLPIEKYFDKEELIKIALEKNLSVKQSWSRKKILEELDIIDNNIIDNLLKGRPKIEEHIKYSIKPEYKEDFEKLMKVIKDNRIVYELLSCL